MSILLTAIAVIAFVALALVLYTAWLRRRYPVPIVADEIHPVTTDDGWKIMLHRRIPAAGPGEPVFLCHGLGANRLNFQLPPGGALVDELLAAGYDCWCIDLRTCRSAVPPPGHSRLEPTVDDFLLKDLPAAVKYVLDRTGYPKLHWIGHSMGGMMMYAYELKHGNRQLASAVTLGAPPGFVDIKHEKHSFLVAILPFVHGWLSWLFLAISPWVAQRRPRSSLLPVNWDNMDPRLGPETMVHLLDLPTPAVGRQMDCWAGDGLWIMCDGTLDMTANLNKIQTPLFAIFAPSDPFIPRRRALAFFEALPNRDKRMLILSKANGYSADYNHIDLAMATHGREEVYRPIVAWLREHPIARTPSQGERHHAAGLADVTTPPAAVQN